MAYTNTPPTSQVTRQVAITSVDAVNQGAHGVSNVGTLLYVDTSYYVGAVSVTPSVGDQWVVKLINGQWRLDHRIPFNDPNQAAVIPTQGQHIVGSGQGPIELQGTQINVAGPLSVASYSSSALPPASTVPAGTHVYDTTLGKPVWSNGTNWTDSGGNVTIAQVTASLLGSGSAKAVDAPREVSRLSGSGRLQARVGYRALLTGHGTLGATGYPDFIRSAALISHGMLSANNSARVFIGAAISGHGAPSLTVVPALTTYSTAGTFSYHPPTWATQVDVITLGGGGGAWFYSPYSYEYSGAPGAWSAATFSTSLITGPLVVTVGTGGSAGTGAAGASSGSPSSVQVPGAGSGGGTYTVSGAGGAGGTVTGKTYTGVPGAVGGSPGNETFDGHTYTGGASSTGPGNAPGGGGGITTINLSSFVPYNGAQGAVFILAYR